MTVVIHGYLVFLDIFLPLNSLFLWFPNGKKKNQRMNDYALHSFQILPGSRSRFRVLIESAGLFFLKNQNDIV